MFDQVEASSTAILDIAFLIGVEDSKWLDTQYPVNNLRNVALSGASTPFVFSIDVDFVCSAGLRQKISVITAAADVSHPTAFIVPAFEWLGVHSVDLIGADLEHEEANCKVCELVDKPILQAALNKSLVSPFHVSNFPPVCWFP
jgi:hypothetical protein